MTLRSESSYPSRGWRAFSAAAILVVLAVAPAPALGAGSGGVGDGEATPPETAPGAEAQLLPSGDAAPPAGAPPQVVRAIEFANRINRKPYVYGGGHQSWKLDKGYDCSGSVSYMLHGAKTIDSPVPSGMLAKWGLPGVGQWITVYANKGHTYAVVAGLRWDTSGGAGPRWHEDMRSPAGYRVRHYSGL